MTTTTTPGPRVDDKGYTATDVCRSAGVSFRQLDYWIRLHVLRPSVSEADGPGRRRRFSEADRIAVGALARLRSLGAPLETLRGVHAALAAHPDAPWLFVASDGRVTTDEAMGRSWGAFWAISVAGDTTRSLVVA